MSIPKDFDGKFTFKISNGFGFLPEDENSEIFTVWFYRRETENRPLKDFLESLDSENVGYDKVSNQLFYRSKSGDLYRMDFTKVR
jgi:hypothetical protein